MTVLDAQAIVAFLADEPAAPEVHELLRGSAPGPSISATNWAEAFDVLARAMRQGMAPVAQRFDWLLAGGLRVIAVDEAMGRASGRLCAEHYHRRDRKLSLADCAALATAQALGQPLATSDPAIAVTAAAIGVALVPLPDSKGRRPA